MNDATVTYRGFLADTNTVNDGMDGLVDFYELCRVYGTAYCTKHFPNEVAATASPERRERLTVFFKSPGLEQLDCYCRDGLFFHCRDPWPAIPAVIRP
jgi:hypothetical protein